MYQTRLHSTDPDTKPIHIQRNRIPGTSTLDRTRYQTRLHLAELHSKRVYTRHNDTRARVRARSRFLFVYTSKRDPRELKDHAETVTSRFGARMIPSKSTRESTRVFANHRR